jgi:hypothetical protein
MTETLTASREIRSHLFPTYAPLSEAPKHSDIIWREAIPRPAGGYEIFDCWLSYTSEGVPGQRTRTWRAAAKEANARNLLASFDRRAFSVDPSRPYETPDNHWSNKPAPTA